VPDSVASGLTVKKREGATLRGLLVVSALLALGALAACGDDDDDETVATAPAGASGVEGAACAAPEKVEGLTAEHVGRDLTAADYETNPPAGGDHSDGTLDTGAFYEDPQPLGLAVHNLEHGAVIGWTNGLSSEDQTAVEDAFNEVFREGYTSLITVENPDMDVPFALSAWGHVQTCESVDTEIIAPFVEDNYGSGQEGFAACTGRAKRLPPCQKQ
jgi:hypothetical protein